MRCLCMDEQNLPGCGQSYLAAPAAPKPNSTTNRGGFRMNPPNSCWHGVRCTNGRREYTMNVIHRTSMTTAAFALATFLSVPAFAQQAPQPAPAPAPAPQASAQHDAMSLEGELVDVDANEKTITVKSADGKEEQLRYTDATKVTGADSGIAGLANTENTRVTVRFTGEGDERLVTDIKVHAKS
jgi:hypothetical protein